MKTINTIISLNGGMGILFCGNHKIRIPIPWLRSYQNNFIKFYGMNGYVLLVVLIFLQIFSCLGLYELISVTTAYKINYHRWLHEVYLLKAKQTLRDIERNNLVANSTCLIPVMGAGELAKKPLVWWQLKGCYRNSADVAYYYVVEALGSDACGLIKNSDINQTIIAYYCRITLFVVVDKIRNVKLILQSTLAKSSPEHLSCEDKPHMVTLGRQMVREL